MTIKTKFILTAGIPEENISVDSRGESQPTVPNDSTANRALNRRVTLEFGFAYSSQSHPVVQAAFRNATLNAPQDWKIRIEEYPRESSDVASFQEICKISRAIPGINNGQTTEFDLSAGRNLKTGVRLVAEKTSVA